MVRSNKETIRLLLVTGDDDDGQNRTDKILTGSANVIRNVTTLITSAIWCICVLLSVLFTFVMVIVVLLLKEKYATYGPEVFTDFIPETAYCKSVNAENLSLIALGYVTGKKDNYFSDSDVASKIYYIINRDLTDQEACAVESALRLFQDKSFFIIDINENSSAAKNRRQTSIDFVKLLSDQYRNLNTIKSKPTTFFNGSPFEKYFNSTTATGDKSDEQILFTAKVLTVWQFGGTAPSVNLIMNNRKVYDNNEGFCEVDKEFLFCPDQCTAYVYELIKTMLNVYNETSSSASNRTFSVEAVVDESIREYCGANVTTIGCVGINRIKTNSICTTVKPYCTFLRMDEWKNKDADWKTAVQKFCPFVVSTVFPTMS